MATASMLTLRFAPAAARPRRERWGAPRTRASAEKAAPKGQAWNDKATVAGGGYGGSCEIEARAARRARRRAGSPEA